MKRRGHTLIEMLAVMSAVTVVVGSLGVVARLSLQVRRQTTDAIDDLRELDRLAFRFRSDARDTVSAELLAAAPPEKRPDNPSEDSPEKPDDSATPTPKSAESAPGESFTGEGWRLRRADGRSIEYRRTSAGLERRLLDGPRIEHRDRFLLDRAFDVRLEPFGDSSVAGAALRLRLRRVPEAPRRAPLPATDASADRATTAAAAAGDERLVVEVVWMAAGARP